MDQTIVASEETEIVVRADHQNDNQDIDIQISTAHRYPRSLSIFRRDALAMATANEETAASCFYSLPRGGKNIDGPSIRLAEIAASSWGNLRFGSRIIREEDKFIVAQGMAHDLQKNIAITIEVRRRITDSKGRRYNDDMVGIAGMAAQSIALRNAIFKVIPKTYIDQIYLEAKKCAIGDATTLAQRRQKCMDYFMKLGVSQEQVIAMLELKGIEDVGLTELEKLIGISSAIKNGESTIDEIFPPKDLNPKRVSQETEKKEIVEMESKTTPGPEKQITYLSWDQVAELEGFIKDRGLDMEHFIRYISSLLAAPSIDKIKSEDFQRARQWLQNQTKIGKK